MAKEPNGRRHVNFHEHRLTCFPVPAKLRSHRESHYDIQRTFILLDNNDQKQQRPIHLITATILQRHAYSSFQRLSSYLWLCKCRKVRHETASHYIMEG